ncbi:MAG: hypothetical protein ACK4M7_06730 [Burkholderiales bacterium]
MKIDKQQILLAYNEALKNYTNKESRGYKLGYFSQIRHSFKQNDKLKQLEKNIKLSQDPKALFNLLIEYFLSKETKYNNHSFSNYFLDALATNNSNGIENNIIDWSCFSRQQIIYYKGILFRGTSQKIEKIFNQGFKELTPSNYIPEYLKYRSQTTGISTSTDFNCARTYALNNKRSGSTRYIYVINYRNNSGYDLIETGKARGHDFNSMFHTHRKSALAKAEVNIKGNILPQDIIGAWEFIDSENAKWLDNPNYTNSHIQIL